MRTEKKNKEARLNFFRTLYEGAKSAYAESLAGYERNMRQYRGSTEIDGSTEQAVTVRNITYEMIESQVSSDIPFPKVDAACYSEKRDRNAKSTERLLCSLRNKVDYETLNDMDERFTYIYGGSVWYLEWDNTARLGKEVGAVRLFCLPPRDFIPQPNVMSVGDMEYCFLRFTTTRDELRDKYGAREEELTLAECDYEEGEGGGEYDTVAVTVAFYKDEDKDVGKFVFSGELLLDDIEKYYHRKRRTCERCGKAEELCRCDANAWISEDQLYENTASATKAMFRLFPELAADTRFVGENDVVPYYVPKSFPIVIRKNTSADGRLFGQSDCEYIRPEQQAINKIESRILKKLLRAGVTPIVPEDASITLNNSVFGQLIKIRPGESAAQYGKVDTTPDISQDIAEAERLYDHSKRVLGISDALQGLDTPKNESGYARQLRINQATGRLESKRRMKHGAYAALDRLIFEHYLAFADEPRALVYKDAFGRIHNTEFCRYDFLEYDGEYGEFYYDDAYLFSADQNAGEEYRREALWERNLENLKAGTLGDPSDPTTLLRYWQSQERAHYPFARENVEYFLIAASDEERRRSTEQGGLELNAADGYETWSSGEAAQAFGARN